MPLPSSFLRVFCVQKDDELAWYVNKKCLNTNLAVDGGCGHLVQNRAADADGGLFSGIDGCAVGGGGVGGSLS